MVDEDSVREIVATYELPQRLEDKLTYIAAERFETYAVEAFDRQYRYIAFLVDRYAWSKTDGQCASLDGPVSVEDDRPLYETVAAPDNQTKADEPDADPSQTSIDRAMWVLSLGLNPVQYRFVEELLQRSRPKYHPRIRQLRGRLEEIRAKFDELAERYRVNGHIAFPRRPIQDISFHPLEIRFGRRHMGSNPLEYYRKHEHVYRGLGRNELFKVDQGLYQALRTSRQLHKAIPDSCKRRR